MAVMRRPAAGPGAHGGGAPAPRRPRRGLHRPAACSDVAEAWEAGEEVPLSGLPLDFVKPGLFLVVTEGEYFGAAAKVAGKVQRVELEPEATFLMMKLTGTNNEEILKAYTGAMEKAFKVHLCPPDCGRVEVGALFLHGMKGRKGLPVGEEAWTSNLETGPAAEEDELAILRKRKAGLEARGVQPQVGEGCQAGASPEKGDVEESKKKKKKKKKEREKEDKLHSGRQPAKAGQKEASQLFAGTALDPKERVRKRVLRKAQRFAARKKYKRSSSSDTSGSSSSSVTTDDGVNIVEGVFTEETKTKAVAERFPGALAMETLMSMRRSLLTTAGEEGEEQSTRPVALLYFRNTLARRAGGAQGRELLNLATAVDALLKSKPAHALDILCQRMKAQEAVLNGTNWAVAQRVELASADSTALIARGELASAQKENYLDSRARWQTQATGPGKGGAPKGKGKTKESSGKDDKKDEKGKDRGKGGERR